jgi:hypothetical protein
MEIEVLGSDLSPLLMLINENNLDQETILVEFNFSLVKFVLTSQLQILCNRSTIIAMVLYFLMFRAHHILVSYEIFSITHFFMIFI